MLHTLSWKKQIPPSLIPYKVYFQAWLRLFDRTERGGERLEFLTFNWLLPITQAVLSSVKGKRGGGCHYSQKEGEQVVTLRWESLCLFGTAERTGDIFGCSETNSQLQRGEGDGREHMGGYPSAVWERIHRLWRWAWEPAHFVLAIVTRGGLERAVTLGFAGGPDRMREGVLCWFRQHLLWLTVCTWRSLASGPVPPTHTGPV